MPHSSGGGSHGGGHSGGSHSYSSGSSSSSPTHIFHISKHATPGSCRYVYYSRRGTAHVIYGSGYADNPDIVATLIGVIVYGFIMLGIAITCFSHSVFVPKPLDLTQYDSKVVIEDHIGLPGAKKISHAFDEFKNATGVTPSIEVVYESEWTNNYISLETFAYSEYLRLFTDEKHWLIVVSFPDDFSSSDFIEWKWEGMIGNECDKMIDSSSEGTFTKTIHQYLLKSTPETMYACLSDAYEELSTSLFKPYVSCGLIVSGLIFALIYVALAWYYIGSYRNAKIFEKAIMISDTAPEYNCEYCGRMYIGGTISVCQGCGAPIPAHNEEHT